MNAKTNNDATILVRLPNELKTQLLRAAAINGRRITAEVNMRLEQSLKAEATPLPATYTAPPPVTRHTTGEEKSPADPLTEIDRAMLAVFRQLPVDKQLALLSLFR